MPILRSCWPTRDTTVSHPRGGCARGGTPEILAVTQALWLIFAGIWPPTVRVLLPQRMSLVCETAMEVDRDLPGPFMCGGDTDLAHPQPNIAVDAISPSIFNDSFGRKAVVRRQYVKIHITKAGDADTLHLDGRVVVNEWFRIKEKEGFSSIAAQNIESRQVIGQETLFYTGSRHCQSVPDGDKCHKANKFPWRTFVDVLISRKYEVKVIFSVDLLGSGWIKESEPCVLTPTEEQIMELQKNRAIEEDLQKTFDKEGELDPEYKSHPRVAERSRHPPYLSFACRDAS